MSETIRYSRLGREDLNFGLGTFEVRLADGRVVTLSQINLAAILSDDELSGQTISIVNLTATSTILCTTFFATGTLRVPNKTDPSTPAVGEVWVNDGSTFLEYSDDQATPAAHQLVGHDTTQTLTNKTLTSPTLTTPVLSGTATGTYALGGTPSLAVALDASDEDITSLDELHFADAATNPTATGRLRRSGNELLWRQSLGSMRLFYGEAGTIMLFQQTAAPTGWTKLTTHDKKALRVVSGAASSGGTIDFDTGLSVASHTLTEAEMPSHAHTERVFTTGIGSAGDSPQSSSNNATLVTTTVSTASTGGGGGHVHTFDLKYVDIILCSKD